eukprot:6667949-Alexandrium_andersonii.AAC.1
MHSWRHMNDACAGGLRRSFPQLLPNGQPIATTGSHMPTLPASGAAQMQWWRGTSARTARLEDSTHGLEHYWGSVSLLSVAP